MSELDRLVDKLNSAPPGRAKYEVIKDFLLEEFDKGNFVEGQLLPSENTLVEILGVARNTVRQAISELEKDGRVQRIQGKGTYFTKHADEESARQSGLFGLILPEISRGLYPVLARGFDHGARSAYHQMVICNTGFDISEQGNIILQLIDKNVAGVALVPALSPPTPAFHIRQLKENGIPVVFCHRGVPDSAAPLITWDWKEVARMAGQAFIDHGHRRIAYFAAYRYSLTEAHEQSLRQLLQDHGLDLPETRVHYGTSLDENPNETHSRIDALETMLDGSEPVTAVLCNDDNEAELINYLLTEMGLKVPQDISLIGFGDSHARTGVFLSRLTSVAVNEFDLGARAAGVLHEMATGRRPADSDEIIYKPLTLVEGKTLCAAPKQHVQPAAGI